MAKTVLTADEFAAAYSLSAPTVPASQPGQYIIYTTQAGDRWDTIAWAQYGDATQITALIFANPGIPILDVLEAGTRIAVPLISAPDNGVTTSPPWLSP